MLLHWAGFSASCTSHGPRGGCAGREAHLSGPDVEGRAGSAESQMMRHPPRGETPPPGRPGLGEGLQGAPSLCAGTVSPRFCLRTAVTVTWQRGWRRFRVATGLWPSTVSTRSQRPIPGAVGCGQTCEERLAVAAKRADETTAELHPACALRAVLPRERSSRVCREKEAKNRRMVYQLGFRPFLRECPASERKTSVFQSSVL